MKNYLYLSVVGCLLWLFPNQGNACGYNFVSSCNTILNVEANGTNVGYYAASCGYLAKFNNKNFGDVTSLLLTYAETVTWESCENHVLDGQLFYRIYETGTTPGSFQLYHLPTLTLLSNGTYRTKKRSNSTTVDLASGLNQGNYTFEIYFTASVDLNNDNLPDGTIAENNNGNYYKAFFNLTNGGTGALNVSFPNKNNDSCSGMSDGTATAAATNGTAPYTFAWSNGQSTATATSLAAGTYTVTVTDTESATGTANVAITQPSAVLPNASATDTNSSSAMNGTATASPFGGTPPYTYAWSNSQMTQTISSLNSGSYTVTVTDANGCIGSQSVFVSVNSGVPVTYCSAQSGFPWTDWISNVEFNQINKNSNKNVYNDFTSDVTDAATSSSYDISVTSSFSWNTHDEYIRVWIDYNRDGVFQEPTEIAFSQILSAPVTFGTSGTVTGSISIPTNAELGGTRMRVIMTRAAYASPCGNIDYGEIEDYTINIVQGGPPVCNLSAMAITSACNNQGTTTMPDDDTYTFDLTVTGTNAGSSWTATIDGQSETGAYGTAQSFGPFLISDGDLNFIITDNLDNVCTDVVSVIAPGSCSNGNICTISSTVSNIICDDAGTNTDATDDIFSFDINVTGTNTGPSWETTIGGTTYTGSYNSTQTISGFLISDGDLNFTTTDESEACAHVQNVTAPASCSNATACNISSTVTNVTCDDTGTNADPSDDTYSLTLTVTGTGTGTGWTANLNGTIVNGNYDVPEIAGPFSIANGSISFTVFDANDSNCNTNNMVIAPSPCSNNGGPANYCAAAGDFPWHDWIANVELADLNKTSGKSQYSDYTNSSADLTAGAAQEIKLTADFSWFTYEEHWKVWIDYNQNGVFEEPAEIAFSNLTPMPPNGTNNDVTTGIINVPSNALAGSTRMRIALSRSDEPEPCGNIAYGEVEDYTVNITAATPLASMGNSNVQLQAAAKVEKIDLRGIAFAENETIDQIIVEKSANGVDFEPLFETNHTNQQLFVLEDDAPFSGANFYRAKMQFTNGEVAYSVIQKVNFTPILDYALFPNPASEIVNLNLEKFVGKAAKVVVSNQLGQPIFAENIDEIRQAIWQLNVAKWREGSYLLWIEVEGYRAMTKKLMVMRGF